MHNLLGLYDKIDLFASEFDKNKIITQKFTQRFTFCTLNQNIHALNYYLVSSISANLLCIFVQ
jgi:hypothetical protein